MSVQSEINRINSAVSSAYDAVSDKGGTLPSNRKISNLPSAIDSIPTGKVTLKYWSAEDTGG